MGIGHETRRETLREGIRKTSKECKKKHEMFCDMKMERGGGVQVGGWEMG